MNDHPYIISYRELRRWIGLLGIALPFVMLVYSLGRGDVLQTSLSAYYHTDMIAFFVGILWAIGVFLYSYRGPQKSREKKRLLSDNAAGNIAGTAAIFVAIFPTDTTYGMLHYGSAVVFFCMLAYFSLRLFTLGRDKTRNMIFMACGWIILLALVLLALVGWLGLETHPLRPFFWLEAIAVWAFGIAWFVKGSSMQLGTRQTAENPSPHIP